MRAPKTPDKRIVMAKPDRIVIVLFYRMKVVILEALGKNSHFRTLFLFHSQNVSLDLAVLFFYNQLMTSLGKIFFRGLITILPIAITIYILYSAIVILDGMLGVVLRQILPTYIPGLGLATIIFFTFLFGLMLNNLVIEKFLSFAEKKLLDVPLIRAVYSPLRDLMNLFSKKSEKNPQQVVFVQMSQLGHLQLGLITRESFEELDLGDKTIDKVAVYFPFSYALGGNTLLIPKSQVTHVNLPIEKAMSLAITGWVKAEKTNEDSSNSQS